MDQPKLPTAEELIAMRQREREATPGEWMVYERKVDKAFVERGIGTKGSPESEDWSTPVVSTFQTDRSSGTWIEKADAAFIASARTDVSQLLRTLDVFGRDIVYEALMHYYNRGLFSDADGAHLEQALEACWRIINSRELEVEPRPRLRKFVSQMRMKRKP